MKQVIIIFACLFICEGFILNSSESLISEEQSIGDIQIDMTFNEADNLLNEKVTEITTGAIGTAY